ncbi:MAG: helix-turn-helix domain-containing protein [Myxococcales bacterium]|nr:helix-turn-helix domain-containing protein [Myxococcales bacterium]
MRTLEDQERSGRAAQVPVEIRCKLEQIACERPAAQEPPAPFRDIWTYESLARSLEEQTGYRLSVSEVGLILRLNVSCHGLPNELHKHRYSTAGKIVSQSNAVRE